MSDPASGTASLRWGDLRNRVLSGLVMLGVGLATIWLGGVVFATLAVVVTGLMIWELSSMTAPTRPEFAKGLGVLSALCLAVVLWLHSPFGLILLLLPSVAGVLRQTKLRIVFVAYALAVMLTGYGLVALRQGQGIESILWIVAIVVVSDIAGYFAGRSLGGPKFWPKVSPKKTWSGTVAGWLGAMLVGLVFVALGGGWTLVWLSPILSFAGQLGDIAESWIKRRTGVKDSSNLIPGHGGVMDRFDALIGAVLVALLIGMVLPLPLMEGY